MFETSVVRAHEYNSAKSGVIIGIYFRFFQQEGTLCNLTKIVSHTQFTIFSIEKKTTLNYSKFAAMGFCPRNARTSPKQSWLTSHQCFNH